ncbi:MAG: hypothetical protein LBB94_09530 [Clostridiales bacterium]|nr:hypothetical protein [Clostridiales bacterium]
MKRVLCRKQQRIIVFVSLLLALLAAVCYIRGFLLDECEDDEDDKDEEEFIDENGVCYTDEKNFVN